MTSFQEASKRHTDAFDMDDLHECLNSEVLAALKDGDEMEAGYLIRQQMLTLIRARAVEAVS